MLHQLSYWSNAIKNFNLDIKFPVCFIQVDSLKEWEMQFIEKYDMVGRLLKPGEKARNYDQESETEEDESKVKKDNWVVTLTGDRLHLN